MHLSSKDYGSTSTLQPKHQRLRDMQDVLYDMYDDDITSILCGLVSFRLLKINSITLLNLSRCICKQNYKSSDTRYTICNPIRVLCVPGYVVFNV
jgi:hypothetical protein